MRKYLVILIILFSGLNQRICAQDPQFSQFYAAPLYLNPAFAGSTELARVGLNYRNQWPSFPATFTTYSVYFDYFFEDYNSGVGLLLMSDKEGLAGLNTTNITLQYAYQLQLTPRIIFRPALEGSYNMKRIDFNNLVFSDQLDFTGQINPSTGEIFNSDFRNNYFDIGAGGLIYSEKFWVGFSANHLLSPNTSLLDEDSPLDRKFSIHMGYKFLLPTQTDFAFRSGYRDVSITPTAQYKMQGQFSQLDAGLYFTYEPVVFGMWYRGLPFKPLDGNSNNESLIFLLGYTSKGLNIGYSYDHTISKLGPTTGGAHEISLRYEFFMGDPRKPAKNIRKIPCPQF
jgi:type IX secretion system PorP/SprF family membrane protein